MESRPPRKNRAVWGGGPPQPGPSAPKRRRIALNEDPLTPPPIEHAANDNLSRDLRDFVHENWGSVRTHVVNGPVQTRYNHRLTSLDTRDLHEPLRELFQEQKTVFKVNCSYGFVLRDKVTSRLRYYHSSNNCCGRLLEEPSLIANRDDFDRFLARIAESDILQWAITQRPNSDWVCEHVTNVTFFLNKILQHPIGCVGIDLPDYVKNNKAVVGLAKDHYRTRTYNDNLCLFRCLALNQGCDVRRLEVTVATLYAKYTDTPVCDFAGVTLDELDEVETTFKTIVVVYKLEEIGDGKTTSELVRRSTDQYPDTMYVNIFETHLSYIKDINMYSRSWRCRNCEQALWKSSWELYRHERTCEAGVNRIYKGGVYRPPSSVFERLDDEGIVVGDSLRFYPYRATFDFESFFTGDTLPADTDHVQWVARHIPLSVSVASNVPGYEPALCFVTDGDADKLVGSMMTRLNTTSDAAFASLLPSYEDVLDELNARKHAWEEETKEEEEEEAEEGRNNPYKTLIGQLLGWLRQLPVIGFNSGRYDLNVVKKFFIPYLLKPSKQDDNDADDEAADEIRFVIKRQNTFMCFATKKLKFLDICNYLAPGVSYAKYLTAYGCELEKGHFPYEYMNDLCKLDDQALPTQTAFFSQLKNEGISDTDYAACQAVWRDNRMTTMRDYLIWYNNRDVEPFLEAIAKQATFYNDRHIDMFKDGISVPGLSLLYLFNGLPLDTNFVTFNRTNSDLHQLVKDNIVGGPAIIFHRYHDKGVTRIPGGEELCRAIVGYDANALYLWALMQDMPTGWYTRRREENGFRPQQAQPFGQMAVQWLNRESERTGLSIRHQANGREKLSVDGWCPETHTAYQFHGCYFHGCPKCHADPEEINAVNGKTMAVLLADTKKHTAYLRRHVNVIEMWECAWKRERDPPPRQKWKMTQQQIIAAVVDGTLFGMIECDIRVPFELKDHFAEMQPIFKNTTVTRYDIGPFMRQYAVDHDIMSTPRRMLVGSYRGDKILLATPLLQWYLAHGLVIDRVYQVVEYHREACFRHFGESVSAARREGDADPDKAIIADTMKLLGNSAYGKTVTNIDRHRNVRYCTEVGTSLLINNKRFRQLDVVTDDAYEVTASKARLTYDLPLHIGFFVYQYAKLRMLQFYYDFVDRYVAGVNNHFIHNRFVTVVHSTSHSSKLIVLTERAVLIVDTSSGPSTSTVRWTPTRRTLRWPATASTTS